MVRLDDDVDGLVLHVDLGLALQGGDALDVDGAIRPLQGREGGRADELVRVA